MAKVSVIIVNYNTGELLTEAVGSIINFPKVEVVVVDNDSKDDSIQILKKTHQAKNLIIIENKENLGFGKAVNQAAKKAKGDYIYLLNPDAEITRKSLNRMIKTAQKHKDQAIIAPRLENPNGTPQPSCYKKQTIANAFKEFWLGKKNAYSKYLPKGKSPQTVYATAAAAWLVPKKIWKKLEGLNEKFFLYFEDLDFCDRLKEEGYKVIYDPQAKVKHHHGISSKTNPIVMQLFTESVVKYHGRFKKLLIDFIIRSQRLFSPPLTVKKLLGILSLWVFAISSFQVLGYFLLPQIHQPLPLLANFWKQNFIWWSWANFDGEHYLKIAKFGYQTIQGFPQYAFFPLYPVLIKTLSLLLRDYYLSARIISLTSAFSFVWIFSLWLKAKNIKKTPRIILSLLLFPGSLFLLAIYTEPLFLLLTISTFYFAEKEKWLKATLTTALATATRVNGVFLALFLLAKLLTSQGRTLKDSRRKAREFFKKVRSYRMFSPFYILRFTIYAFLSFSGLFFYMLYLYKKTGNALAFYTSQKAWGKATPTSPLRTFSSYLRAITVDFIPDLTHLVVVVEVLLTGLAIYLVVKSIKNKTLDFAYHTFLLGNLLLPLLTGSLGSMPRFSLLLFPSFIVIENFSKRKTFLLFTFYLLLLTTGTILFTRGYWFA